MEGKRKEWRLIRAVLPSLAAPAVSLGVGGVDGVECVTLSGPSVVKDHCVLRYIDCTYTIVICQAFFAIFSGHEKKSAKSQKKVVDRYTDV